MTNTFLPDLVEALKAFGVESEHRRGMIQIKIKGTDLSGYAVYTNWDGKDEDGLLAFFLRDQVRRVAETAACSVDFDGKVLTHAVDFDWTPETWDKNPGIPRGTGYQPIETSAWASALIAINKAGMAPGGEE